MSDYSAAFHGHEGVILHFFQWLIWYINKNANYDFQMPYEVRIWKKRMFKWSAYKLANNITYMNISKTCGLENLALGSNIINNIKSLWAPNINENKETLSNYVQ